MSIMRRFMSDKTCILAERLDNPTGLKNRGFTIGGNPGVENGKFGRAFTFDGSTPDYLAQDKQYSNLIGTDDFSVVVCMKNSQPLTSHTYCLVADKETSNTTKIGWVLQLKGDGATMKGLAFRINDGGQANDDAISISTDRSALLSDGGWHLVGALADRSGNVTLLVDEFSGETGVISGQSNTLSNDQDLVVGVYGDKSTQPFTGSIAFVIIWKRLITETEFQNIWLDKAF